MYAVLVADMNAVCGYSHIQHLCQLSVTASTTWIQCYAVALYPCRTATCMQLHPLTASVVAVRYRVLLHCYMHYRYNVVVPVAVCSSVDAVR